MLDYLDKIQARIYRSQVNEIVQIIVSCDFPYQFQDLYDYLRNKFDIINKLEGADIFDENVFILLKSVKRMFVQKIKRKTYDNKEAFDKVYVELIAKFHPFWVNLHDNMKTFIENGGNNNDNMIDAYFKLARRCDAIYFAFLCRGCYEMVEQ